MGVVVNGVNGISTHAPRTGSDVPCPSEPHSWKISTHAPRTGSDHCRPLRYLCQQPISTHAPRTGSDYVSLHPSGKVHLFQPTLPARGATALNRFYSVHQRFQPTLPARGATENTCKTVYTYDISTHAPRTGSDGDYSSLFFTSFYISTHAPRTGSDQISVSVFARRYYFNPRSPHGERLWVTAYARKELEISTHAPRTGSDNIPYAITERYLISTHAPRTGSDPKSGKSRPGRLYFNPRSPHGERPTEQSSRACGLRFQPTLPARGATASIRLKSRVKTTFQPTLPARGATNYYADLLATSVISTHAPRTGSDTVCIQCTHATGYFNPRSPHGERHRGG